MLACALAGVVALLARLMGLEQPFVAALAGAIALGILLTCALDLWVTQRRWIGATPSVTRQLPRALAIGVAGDVSLSFINPGASAWQCQVYDHTDPSFEVAGLPRALLLTANGPTNFSYRIIPRRRGSVTIAGVELRVRSRLRLLELRVHLPVVDSRSVYPDFAQVARYAWLAGDRRLAEIGIKSFQQRGQGTDFKQLSEYRPGDAVRHIDWKATQRHLHPIVREFQDERDQRVMFLIDCGRRMRAVDGESHFDQVLNAVMLLSYVALKQGDAVGAITFGTSSETAANFEPRKGVPTLNALMNALHAIQPTTTHSDYLGAARDFLRQHRKRSLVVFVTNFRDEDGSELKQALQLLRTRHLVMLASLQERVAKQIAEQPVSSGHAALEVAGALLYQQTRHDAFKRLAARDALMIDVEPQRLAAELVNRYHAIKREALL